MKSQSVLRFAATALLVPVAGFAIAQSGSHFASAVTNPSLTQASLIAQNTPEQMPEGKEHQGRKGHWGERGGEMFKELNLTADQQAKIKAIREQEKSASTDQRKQMKAAFEQMRSLSAGNATDAQLRAKHQQVRQLRQQFEDRRFETMLKIRAVLTPEQRSKMAELKQKHRRGGHRGFQSQAGGMIPGNQPF
jgi:periplasmic protein CpxP/Spy